jgi:23S rRNA-/tRNA-specific pseudouridylate synthase
MSDAPKRRSSKVDSGCSSASDGGRKFRYCRDKTSRPEPIYEFLAKKFAYLSEEGWKDLIKNSQHIDTSSIGVANAATVTTPYVMVNTSVCSDPHYILQQQDLIGFVAPAVLEPDVDETFTVLYDDPCMIAVCKSGNIPVCTGGRYRHNTLERVVYSYLCAKQDSTAAASSTSPPPPPAIYPVHRLDKETSGVTIFAKTKGVSQRLSMLFGSKEEAITPNHAHTKDESSDISSRCSPDTLPLQHISP